MMYGTNHPQLKLSTRVTHVSHAACCFRGVGGCLATQVWYTCVSVGTCMFENTSIYAQPT